MSLHSAIDPGLDPLMLHANGRSNFCNCHQNCCFRHFLFGLWTPSCLIACIAIAFFIFVKIVSFSSFWLVSLDPVMPNAISLSNFFVILVKIVVSVIFLKAFGRFHGSRKHSAIFVLCLSVSLTTSDYL